MCTVHRFIKSNGRTKVIQKGKCQGNLNILDGSKCLGIRLTGRIVFLRSSQKRRYITLRAS